MLFVMQLAVAFLAVVLLYALRIDRYFRTALRATKPDPAGGRVLRVAEVRPVRTYRVRPIIRDAVEFIPEAPIRN